MDDLAERFRPHLDALWQDKDRVVQAVTRAVTAQVDSYASTPSAEVWIGMTRILERAVTGNPFTEPTAEDRLAALGTGSQGAGAGIAPADLVSAVLLGARSVEADILERAAAAGMTSDDLLDAARRARAWAEQMAVWALEALLSAAADEPLTRRHPQRSSARLIAALAVGDLDAAREQAQHLDLDPARTWWSVAVRRSAHADAGALSALRLANPGGHWQDGVDDQPLLAIVPRPPVASGELVVGVAGPTTLEDAPAALRDARRAARVGVRFDVTGLVDLVGLGLLVPLAEDPAQAQRLHRRWVAPLQTAPTHELPATLRVWLEADGRIEVVADQLGIHPNTVRNRLTRVDALLGEWRRPRHRAELWAALHVAGAAHPPASRSEDGTP